MEGECVHVRGMRQRRHVRTHRRVPDLDDTVSACAAQQGAISGKANIMNDVVMMGAGPVSALQVPVNLMSLCVQAGEASGPRAEYQFLAVR